MQKIEKQPISFSKRWMVALLLLSLLFLGACNNKDNNNAYDGGNESLYTNPNNGNNTSGNTNGNDDNFRNGDEGVRNGTNRDGNDVMNGVDPNGNGTINEGTINNNDNSFRDEARDIIDDTNDMIEGRDGRVNNPQSNTNR